MLLSHPEIPLKDHLREVGNKALDSVSNKQLNLTLIDPGILPQIAYLVGTAHDFGKATTFFQRAVKNEGGDHRSHHAQISSVFAYEMLAQFLPEVSIVPELGYLAVRHHHGNLQSPGKTLRDDLTQQWGDIENNNHQELKGIYEELWDNYKINTAVVFKNLRARINSGIERFPKHKINRSIFNFQQEYGEEKGTESFLLTNFLFSLLVDADKKAAAQLNTDHFSGVCEPILDVSGFLNHCRETQPEKFDPESSINQMRNEFFQSVTNSAKLNQDNHLYTLTAPTGIGKTLTAYQVTSELKKQLEGERRVIYALPYTSIIDQNYEVLREVMEWQDVFEPDKSRHLLKHHYLSTMANKTEDINSETAIEYMNDPAQYLKERMTNETWESGYVVTTFVQLFHSLVGYQNRFLKKFHNIANSIVVLDEVQNIPAEYFNLVNEVFKVFAKRFDTYFVLMTATQPEIFEDDIAVELSPKERFFNASEFNRVQIQKQNNLKPVELSDAQQKFISNISSNNAMFVFNTKKSAIKSYEEFTRAPEFDGWEKFCLTTYLTPNHREQKIREINRCLEKDIPTLVASTQLVEAGVDVSFEEVWRDLGPLDSIVQVAGRCNRNGEYSDSGIVTVVSMEGEEGGEFSGLYDTKMIDSARAVLQSRESIDSSDFLKLGDDYFSSIDFEMESRQLIKGICHLNYSTDTRDTADQKPVKDFQLIDELPYQEDLVVCDKQSVQDNLLELDQIYDKFSEAEGFSKKRNQLMGRAELLKKRLAHHTITVASNEIDQYRKTDDIRFTRYKSFQFIPSDKLENAYSDEFGFIYDPDLENLTTTKIV